MRTPSKEELDQLSKTNWMVKQLLTIAENDWDKVKPHTKMLILQELDPLFTTIREIRKEIK